MIKTLFRWEPFENMSENEFLYNMEGLARSIDAG